MSVHVHCKSFVCFSSASDLLAGKRYAQLLGVDPLQAGNVVQLLVVLGMTVGWISTYMFRVANKDMTYAHQLRDYEKQVMEVRFAAYEFIASKFQAP